MANYNINIIKKLFLIFIAIYIAFTLIYGLKKNKSPIEFLNKLEEESILDVNNKNKTDQVRNYLKIKYHNEKLNKYTSIHNKLIKINSSHTKISLNKSPNNGYANRIYSFLTSLVAAILTDSAILVEWNFGSSDNIGKYIDTPFKNIFCTNQKYNELWKRFLEQKNSSSCVLEPIQATKIVKNMSLVTQARIDTNCLIYFFNKYRPTFMEFCCNEIYFEKLLYYNLVSDETINRAKQALLKTSKLDASDKQHALFKIGYEVGGNLLNQIWLPKAPLKKMIDHYVDKEFKNNFVIGIQLRYHYLNKIMDVYKFIECAIQIENEYKKESKIKNFRWFIISDSQENLNEIFYYYPQKAFTANGTITHVHYDPKGYDKAIVDVELLSRYDEMIITSGSTFGFIASMKILKMPYYVNGFDLDMKSCRRNSLGFKDISKIPTNQNAIF